MRETCPLCSEEADRLLDTNPDGVQSYNCKVCGKYLISSQLVSRLGNNEVPEVYAGRKLSAVLHERKLIKTASHEEDTLDEILCCDRSDGNFGELSPVTLTEALARFPQTSGSS